MGVGDKIKSLRKAMGLTQTELGERVGVKKNAVSKWECGRVEDIPTSTIKALANLFSVSPSYLIDDEGKSIPSNFNPMPEMKKIPRVGRIACGEPITAEENLEGYVSVPSAWHATFTLQCRGDSMEPTIHDGDLVAIRKDIQVENGQIAAVRIGDEATLKHLYLHDDYIELRPENPNFSSIIRRKEEMNDVAIEGKAVGLCRGL